MGRKRENRLTLNTNDIACILGVSVTSVRRMICEGTLRLTGDSVTDFYELTANREERMRRRARSKAINSVQ